MLRKHYLMSILAATACAAISCLTVAPQTMEKSVSDVTKPDFEGTWTTKFVFPQTHSETKHTVLPEPIDMPVFTVTTPPLNEEI